MGRHDKEKDPWLKSKSRIFKANRSSIHNLASPASTAPQPMTIYAIENGSHTKSAVPPSVPAGSVAFSSPLPTRVPGDLHSSPSYIAQQAPKRKRDWEGERSGFNASIEGHLNGSFRNVGARVRTESGSGKHINAQENVDEVENRWSRLASGKKDDNQGLKLDLLSGMHEAAKVKGDDQVSHGQEDVTDSMLSSSSESESEWTSDSLSSSSSSDDEGEDKHNNEFTSEDGPSEAVTGRPESPLKRLKRKYSTSFRDDAPTSESKSSVATRNPPPPELEGQFKYSNSIVGNNVYRYPKAVLDAFKGLESLVPKSVVEFVTNNPGEQSSLHTSSSFMRKHAEGNEDTKRVLVLLDGARHLITHLGKATVARAAAEERMKEELMRIAREREREAEGLRAQSRRLRAEVEVLREGKKSRRN